MRDYQPTEQTLLDTFRHGEVMDKGDKIQVTRKYANYSVGMVRNHVLLPSSPRPAENVFITCWKGGE
jgi:hypothetical protein